MAIKVTGTTINIYQGDSGSVIFTGLEEGMHIYFAIRDKENNLVIPQEKDAYVDVNGDVEFKLTAEETDNIFVDINKIYTVYYYGIKEVDDETGEENTVFLGEHPCFGDKYLVKVYLKKVEGLEPDNAEDLESDGND